MNNNKKKLFIVVFAIFFTFYYVMCLEKQKLTTAEYNLLMRQYKKLSINKNVIFFDNLSYEKKRKYYESAKNYDNPVNVKLKKFFCISFFILSTFVFTPFLFKYYYKNAAFTYHNVWWKNIFSYLKITGLLFKSIVNGVVLMPLANVILNDKFIKGEDPYGGLSSPYGRLFSPFLQAIYDCKLKNLQKKKSDIKNMVDYLKNLQTALNEKELNEKEKEILLGYEKKICDVLNGVINKLINAEIENKQEYKRQDAKKNIKSIADNFELNDWKSFMFFLSGRVKQKEFSALYPIFDGTYSKFDGKYSKENITKNFFLERFFKSNLLEMKDKNYKKKLIFQEILDIETLPPLYNKIFLKAVNVINNSADNEIDEEFDFGFVPEEHIYARNQMQAFCGDFSSRIQ